MSPAPHTLFEALGRRVPLPGGLEVSFAQIGLISGIVFYALAVPGSFDYKLDAMGFGVCHQIYTHSFSIGGHQLPLCARCTGIYLGAIAGLGLLMALRRRAVLLPASRMISILALFFGVMLADGINSTFQTFGSGLWETTNLVRVVTGALAGIAVPFFFYPMFNLSLWHKEETRRERVLEQPFELIAYVVAAALLVALVLDGGDWLLFPISVLSIIGMLALLTMANTMLVLIITRSEARYHHFSEALSPILLGLLLSLVMLTLLAWGRAALAPQLVNNFGMPLVPGLP